MGPDSQLMEQIEATLREHVVARYGASGLALDPEDNLLTTGVVDSIFPQTALWWLEEYAGLRDYLEADSGEVGRSEAGIVYALPAA